MTQLVFFNSDYTALPENKDYYQHEKYGLYPEGTQPMTFNFSFSLTFTSKATIKIEAFIKSEDIYGYNRSNLFGLLED